MTRRRARCARDSLNCRARGPEQCEQGERGEVHAADSMGRTLPANGALATALFRVVAVRTFEYRSPLEALP